MSRGRVPALLALVALACAGEPGSTTGAIPEGPDASRPSPMSGGPGDPRFREAVLGPFLAGYWELPVPHQGEPPEAFSPAEASLDPQVCAACHPDQHAQWRESLHAGAFSPGFAGQLLEGSLAVPRKLRHCQTCHAPLAEQQPVLASGEAEPHFDPALRAQGIVCAACHVRAHVRFGPPRREDLPPPAEVLPHGGFEAREEFQQARFCATCHQFWDAGVAGKPIQNTFVEWRESPHAAAGRSCQDCHMEGRAHTWRGIHDAETVREAVDVTLRAGDLAGDAIEAALVVTSHGVGHAFPSYVTPRVFLSVWQEGADGRALEGTRAEATLGRKIDFGASPSEEVFDTRIPAGGSHRLGYARPRADGARSLRARVEVDPGHHYRGVYRRLLNRLESEEARTLIAEALRREQQTPYVLAERSLALPAGD